MEFPFSIYVWHAPRNITDKPFWQEELRANTMGNLCRWPAVSCRRPLPGHRAGAPGDQSGPAGENLTSVAR